MTDQQWLLFIIYAIVAGMHSLIWITRSIELSWEMRPIDSGGLGLTPIQYLLRRRNWVRWLLFSLLWPLMVLAAVTYGIILGFKEFY